MFLVIDSSPTDSAEPCTACKTLIEVGPPPLLEAGFAIVKLSPQCHHIKKADALPDLSDNQCQKSCA